MDELPKLQKILHQPEPLWMKRKREGYKTMTAGQSFYAPYKRRNRPSEEAFPQGKYPYYCALVLEAALELNPSLRPQVYRSGKSDSPTWDSRVQAGVAIPKTRQTDCRIESSGRTVFARSGTQTE